MSVESPKQHATVVFNEKLSRAEITDRILQKLVTADVTPEIQAEITELIASAEPGTIVEIPKPLLVKINQHNLEESLLEELERFRSYLRIALELAKRDFRRLASEIDNLAQEANRDSTAAAVRDNLIEMNDSNEKKMSNIERALATRPESLDDLVIFLKSKGRKVTPPRAITDYSFEIEPKQIFEPIVTIGPIEEVQPLEAASPVLPQGKLKHLKLAVIPVTVAALVLAVLANKMTDGDAEELTVDVEEGSEEIPNSIAEFQKLQEIYDRDPNMQFVFNIIAYQLSVAMPLNTGREHAFTFSLRKPQSLTIPLPYTNIIDWSEFTYSITTYPDSNIHKLSIWADGERENAITLDVQLSTGL